MSFFISVCVPCIGMGLLCSQVCFLIFLYCTCSFLYWKCLTLNPLSAWFPPYLCAEPQCQPFPKGCVVHVLLSSFFISMLSTFKVWRVCSINCQIKKGKYWLINPAQENKMAEVFPSLLLTLFSSQRLCLCGKDEKHFLNYLSSWPRALNWNNADVATKLWWFLHT